MVGMVRWCRFRPDLKENLSGGAGFVRRCRLGMWDETWDFLNNRERQGPVMTTTSWIRIRSLVHLDSTSLEPHSGPGSKNVQALELQLIE
jgi:hypothetical protein